MNLKKISDVLEMVSDGYAKKFKIKKTPDWHLLKIQEEVGELTASYLKMTKRGRKKNRTPAELAENLRHEVADVLAMTLLFARDQGIDAEQAIKEKWFQYLKKKG